MWLFAQRCAYLNIENGNTRKRKKKRTEHKRLLQAKYLLNFLDKPKILCCYRRLRFRRYTTAAERTLQNHDKTAVVGIFSFLFLLSVYFVILFCVFYPLLNISFSLFLLFKVSTENFLSFHFYEDFFFSAFSQAKKRKKRRKMRKI